MKFPYAMLRDFVETNLDAEQVGDLLTMAGFELEGIEEVEGDYVLDIKVVSNRGDGLSVFGLAREVLAKDAAAKPTEHYAAAASGFGGESGQGGDLVSIETLDCTRFGCLTFEGAKEQDSPDWLQKRLRQAGMRPISLVVDCTNYVMLEIGQPMHMYDLDTLRGGRIVVRNARRGERLTTLNGIEHELRPDQMMICDAERPVGAAGVMGGLETEVTSSTKRMLLEAAHFVNTSARRTRKQLGLSTEASYRFERSVDPEGVVAAIHRFAQLYAECGGSAKPVGSVVDVYPNPPKPVALRVRMSRTNTLLGLEVSDDEAERYLRALGFGVERKHQPASSLVAFEVTAPTWRPDIVREDDVIEEIGRVHGFDRIPETLPHGATTRGGQPELENAIDLIREKLLRAGFHQIVSHTLRDAHPLDAPGERVGPRNPGSPELALLRNSTWPSLAEAAARNGGKNVHLFETGRVFCPEKGERRMLGVYSQGALYPTHRQNDPSPSADFFTLKGVAESLTRTLDFRPGSDPRLHPTRQAEAAGLGVIGEIHPDAAEEAGLPVGSVLLEFDLEKLAESSHTTAHYSPISKNPAVRRDIAFLVSKATPYKEIESALERACGDVLERLWLFDIYEGKGVPEGQHSLAVALQLRKMGENFTDEEANQVRESAVAALVSLGASPRV